MAALSEFRLTTKDHDLLLDMNLPEILVEKYILPNSESSAKCVSMIGEISSMLLKSLALQVG